MMRLEAGPYIRFARTGIGYRSGRATTPSKEATEMGNPIAHWELMVSDLDKAKEFYTTVFDWMIEEAPAFPGYPMIDPGKEPRGAMMVKPDMAPAHALNTYFGVDNVEQTLARAVTAGGTMLVPSTPIEGVGEWAMFADPDGIPIGIFHAK
jgi:predicted enzyme related to lactoylglutathione lyase